jgi:large subunit ribosomal protein L4
VLVVLSTRDDVAAKAFRNLPHVQLIEARELNAYDVLVNDVVVFTRATLPSEGLAPIGADAPAATAEPEEAAE